MTNDTSGRVPGASCVSRDTPDLSRTPFLTGLPRPDPLKRFPEGRFSGSKRLPVNLRGTSTEIRDPSDPRTPQDIRGTLRKPRSQVPRSSWGNGLRSGTTSQRSPTSHSLSKNLSSSSPLPHLRPARAKAKTGQNHRKTTRYSGDHPTRLKPKITKLPSLHISHPLSPFLGLVFPFEASIIAFCPHKESGPETGNRAHPSPPRVPLRSTTLASRAITFKGFLTTLTLPQTIRIGAGDRSKFETSQGPLGSFLREVAESSRTPPGFKATSLVVSDRSLELGVLMFGSYC
ncbi:hypothetical protein CRG98_005823 [Punica granatum]|uniref:Uncharacterized protein n=1 Tax=Punica granatum TaxID=22663 RepID=A0A2I0KZP4_PUNGR|nr:hypothetical protein CRG98_005823 [Punica granatum]